MKSKYVNVWQISLKNDQKYQHQFYPYSGLYEATITDSESPLIELIAVQKTSMIVMMIVVLANELESAIVDEIPTNESKVPEFSGVSENTMLKAIALSQKPELIKEILK